jgi:hypothetical protein
MKSNVLGIGKITVQEANSDKLHALDLVPGNTFVPRRNEVGEVIANEKDEVWGTVMVKQDFEALNNNMDNSFSRPCFIRLKEERKHLFPMGKEIPGVIMREVSFTKFSPNQNPITNPKTGEVMKYDEQGNIYATGRPMYQNFRIDTSISSTDIETFMQKDNAIVEAVTPIIGVKKNIDASKLFEQKGNEVLTPVEEEVPGTF